MDQANVSNANSFYDRQYSVDDLQRLADMNSQDMMMGMMASGGMDMANARVHGGQPFDQMLHRHSKDPSRRRSFHNPNHYRPNRPTMQEGDPRRSSMLEFGSGSNGDLDGFQFNPGSSTPSSNGMQRSASLAQRRMESQRARRQQSQEQLALSTSFPNMPTTYGSLPNSSTYPNLHSADSMGFDMSSSFMNANMLMGLDFSNSLDSHSAGGIAPRNSYGGNTNHNNFTTGIHSSPVQEGMQSQANGQMHDPGGGAAPGGMNNHNLMDKMADVQMPEQMQNVQSRLQQSHPMSLQSPNPGMQMQSDGNNGGGSTTANNKMTDLNQMQKTQSANNLDISANHNGLPFENQNPSAQQVIPQYRNAYSSSGFDMLGVLMRVAARPKPQINIGAVDMSCAFVVCDVTMHDIPIVYCSDVFERLTAYTRHEILGRNCRFLQAPDGKIKTGTRRKYVDDQSVYRIKKMITARQEAQISVINYRKGGQPFMNLLTMIPITWDSDEIKYYVGFQVDLVEQPSSVTNKNPDGTYAINYQRGPTLPRYIIPDSQHHSNAELGQTVNRDDVSTVLSTIGSGESELSKRIWDKVLLENTDDVVHVLSLKGLFLYLSPSSRRVLEYDPAELVGTALSSVCHPSDIVPVTRELKDTSTGTAVNVVFRIRRKHSGYTWFESHGSLHLEQGKGRKCIIMVGRERPVYALARNEVDSVGGIGESELWTKMSTSGMFLFVSSNVRSLLDRQPEDLVGTSAQALMRPESKIEFGKKLELARTGVKATFKHDVQNKRGQTLQARTTIYPGDAQEGQKPTFLVAQTRLLKLSRANNRQNPNISPKTDQKSNSTASSASALSGSQTPSTAPSQVYGEGITTQAGGCGLVIGNQHEALASEENVFDELKTTRSTSWQFELRQMEKRNRLLAEELQSLLSNKKKRKRRNGAGNMQKDCANCHTRVTPEWRRGPSGNRDLCNSCGLRWAKENGRVTPRTSSQQSDKSKSASPSRSNSLNAALSTLDPVSNGNKLAANNTSASSSNHNTLTNPSTNTSSSTAAMGNGNEKRTTSQTSMNVDSHNEKVARMEATASQGFGGGIPPKIEEGVEPPMADFMSGLRSMG